MSAVYADPSRLLAEGVGVNDSESDPEVQASLTEQILEALQVSPQSAKDLRSAITCSSERLSQRLYEMRSAGRIVGTPVANGGGRERLVYSLPSAVEKPASPAKGRRKTRPWNTSGKGAGVAALRESACCLESVLLGALPESFHNTLKSYGRICGLIR